MQSICLFVLLVLLLATVGSSTAKPTRLPTRGPTGSPTGSANTTDDSSNDKESGSKSNNKEDDHYENDQFNYDDTLPGADQYIAYYDAMTKVGYVIIIPSIISGALLSVLLARLIWRKKSTAFDSLVLALTLWQLLMDLILFIDPDASAGITNNYLQSNRHKSDSLAMLMCRPNCPKQVTKYKDGDDWTYSHDDKNDEGDDQGWNNYSVLSVEVVMLRFIRNIAYQASAFESTCIVLTVVYIVFRQTQPKALRHYGAIQLAIFLVSLLCPLSGHYGSSRLFLACRPFICLMNLLILTNDHRTSK